MTAAHAKFSVSALVLAGLMLPAAASAQAPAPATAQGDDTEVTLDAIVVSATKRGQTLIEAPLSVAVVDAEVIARTGATNFNELSTLIPSVVFSSAQSPIQANVGIRGVTTAGGSAALEPSVGIYIDGVFTDRTAIGIGEFNDIARVEVLRGPQATVFGNASPAGIINFVTKRPEAELGGDIRATYGNYDRRQIAASITGPIAGDRLLGRLSAYLHKRDGYINNLVGPDSNDQDAVGVRGKLLFKATDSFEALLSVEYGHSEQNCCTPLFDYASPALINRFATAAPSFPFSGTGVPFPANNVDDLTVAVDGRNFYRQENVAVSLELNWDLPSGHRLTSTSAFRSVDQLEIQDIDFTAMDLLLFPRATRDNKQYSQELRLTSPAEGPFSYLLGAYYFRKDVQEASGLQINASLAGLLGGNILPRFSPSGSDITNQNWAVFGEGTLELGDGWSVTGGLRYNFDDKHITAFAQRLRANGTELSPTQTIPAAFQNRDGGQLTWKAVIKREWSDDWNSYASYTRGYKAFGINDDANLLRNVPGASYFFDSEVVDNFELGLKGTIRPLNTSVSLVLFHTKYDDFQALSSFVDPNGNIRFFLQNAASLTSQGVELDLTSQLSDHWTVSGSLVLLDAEFDSFPNAEGPTGPIDLSGRPLRDAPDVSASLVVRYDRPIGANWRVFGQGDVFYRSKVFTDQNLDPLLVQGAHAKLNLRLGFGPQDGRWSFEVWGRNLTDQITFGRGGQPVFGAVTGVLPLLGVPSFPTAGSRVKFVGEPRTYGVSVGYTF